MNLETDNRAVSPVIGVILMVAITVILAAVIGTFVLDLGQSAGQSAPQASLSVSTAEAPANEVTIEHNGGDALSQERTRILVEKGGTTVTFNTASSSGTMSVGGSVTLDVSGGSVVSGDLALQHDSGAITLNPGDQVTVTLVDTESQRQIYQTTVTV